MRKLKIAGAALNQTPLNWKGNLDNIIQATTQARQQQADILLLPELCITGYGCEDWFLSDWLSEKAWKILLQLLPHSAGITVCAGLPVRIKNKTYNGVAVISNEKLLGITLKQNLAKDGVHYEPRWFEAWKPNEVIELNKHNTTVRAGDLIYEVLGIPFGFEICEDAWRVNRPGYALKQRNVELILNPSASHFALGKSSERESLVTESSSQLKCVYAYVNLLGNEAGRMIYDGDILIAQHGKLLVQNARLSFKPVNVLCCEVDVDNVNASEQKPVTDNKERYEELTRAVTLALFDYLRKSKARGYVVSLSGGADSATCTVMVAEMIKRASAELGWPEFSRLIFRDKHVTGYQQAIQQLLTTAYQSTQNSSTTTFEAAKQLAESVGAVFYHWSVNDEVKSYTEKIEKALGRKLEWNADGIALQNIQARARSPIIWLLANVKQSILLTTSNRSEGDVGYSTMDGDTSGSLAPISAIDKPTILEWLKWAEKNLGYTSLKLINQLKPTAELRPGKQTDEDDLMPYTVLVAIEKEAIRQHKSPAEVYHALKNFYEDKAALKKNIRKFFTLWASTQWKRERLAPSFHLDEMNVDPRTWCRFPILSSGFTDELNELESL
ncbi:MAG: NAD(+) synthase [Flammeovirgaceae bacterium]|nr:MAG: NAD(+) synthase [Flammeovirgaceae bacterium]